MNLLLDRLDRLRRAARDLELVATRVHLELDQGHPLRRELGDAIASCRETRAHTETAAVVLSPPLEACALVDRANVRVVLDVVARAFGVTATQLRGRERHRQIAAARAGAMILMRRIFHLSYPRIGAWLGGRDHGTVMSTVRNWTEYAEVDPTLRAQLEALERQARDALSRPTSVNEGEPLRCPPPEGTSLTTHAWTPTTTRRRPGAFTDCSRPSVREADAGSNQPPGAEPSSRR